MNKFALGLVVGIVIGGIGVGVYSHYTSYQAKERELAGMALLQYVADAGMATRGLQVLDEERYDTLRRLLITQRDSGLDESYRLTASQEPVVDAFAAPHLLSELDRVASYMAETDAKNHLLAWSHKTREYVQRASVER